MPDAAPPSRRAFLRRLAALAAAPVAGSALTLAACQPDARRDATAAPSSEGHRSGTGGLVTSADSLRVHPPLGSWAPVERPNDDWRDLVSEEAFRILFEDGTEPRYASPLLDEKRAGTFICAACHLPLFPSTTKYESGTGWPSFWAPVDEQNVGTEEDTRFGMVRTEYHCARCGGHQGHVFEDGPEPTGLRYCNNGLALAFVLATDDLPALRPA